MIRSAGQDRGPGRPLEGAEGRAWTRGALARMLLFTDCKTVNLEDWNVRDLLAFVGAMYGAVVGATAGGAVLARSGLEMPLRFGVLGTSGLALMGFGIAAYSFYKFARDD